MAPDTRWVPTPDEAWSAYHRWMQLAETGTAEEVLAEIEERFEAIGRHEDIPALWLSVKCTAFERLRRCDEAMRALEQAAAQAESQRDHALQALLASKRATLLFELDHLESLRQYAHAESIVQRYLERDGANRLWPNTLFNFSVVAIQLGQTERALAIMRTSFSLGERVHSKWDWFALNHNYAETLVGSALRSARQEPFLADQGDMAEAVAYGKEATQLADELGVSVKACYREVWEAIRQAWLGDPGRALEVLDPAVDGEGHFTDSLLWLAAASRLRALRRRGDTARVAAVLAAEKEMADSLPRTAWDTVAPLLWERTLAVLPQIEDRSTELGLLTSAWESRDADRQRYAQILIDTMVEQVNLDAERREQEARALHDNLTGLLNRRGFEPHLRRAAADNLVDRWALLVIDLDKFKEINDTAGHAAGDEALVSLANILVRNCRRTDYIARFGGDEFVVLVDGGDRIDSVAARLAQRLVHAAARASRPLSVSIGIAAKGARVSAEEWLHTADSAMYRSKRTGGGRYTTASRVVPIGAQPNRSRFEGRETTSPVEVDIDNVPEQP